MKKHLLFFGLFGCGVAFGQNQVITSVTNSLLAGPEIFRFDQGYASQIQSGTGFGTGTGNRWLTFG
jgi:uncharacterized membrane protein